jgi:hypothetical protein
MIGGVAFLGGIALCILGLAGSIEFFFEGGGVKARLLNASPGIAVAFLGFLVLWKYKAQVRSTSKTKQVETTKESPSGSRSLSVTSETYEHRSQGSRLSPDR